MKTASFFAELKRRNVYKVAVAYAVVGWLVMQVASTVVPALHLSESITSTVVLLTLLGFPIALVLAWAFELTPEGVKRADETKPAGSKGHAWIYIVITAAALSIGLFFLGRFTAPSKQSPSAEVSSKSIAVLPFESLSEDKSNAYFAEGIQDEILTRLSKIGTLKVISRTSTAHYATSPQNLPEIAKQLGVANILEGNVQKVNDAVRINVQLMRAATDDHFWAESYDRKLSDIFGVEAEVAQKIASSLNAKLTGAEEEMLAQRPTNNPRAYELYLRGTVQARSLEPQPIAAAAQSFSESVQLDPQFAEAWAAWSKAESLLFALVESTPGHKSAAERALAEAMRLAPDSAETRLAQVYYEYRVKRDNLGARDMLRQLRATWPGNFEIIEALAFVSARTGDWKDSLSYFDQAIELNPRDKFLRTWAAFTRDATRDFRGTLRMLDDALEIWPNDSDLLGLKAGVFQAEGKLDEAQAVVNYLKPGDQDQFAISALFNQAAMKRDPKGALPYFRSLAARAEHSDTLWGFWNSSLAAELEAFAGEKVEAQASFTKIRDRIQAMPENQKENPQLLPNLARVLARLGERDAAFQVLDRAALLTQQDARERPSVDEDRARVLAFFEVKDEAITILQKLLVTSYDGPLTPAWLRLDPDWDNLRNDSRFQKLCQEKPK